MDLGHRLAHWCTTLCLPAGENSSESLEMPERFRSLSGRLNIPYFSQHSTKAVTGTDDFLVKRFLFEIDQLIQSCNACQPLVKVGTVKKVALQPEQGSTRIDAQKRKKS